MDCILLAAGYATRLYPLTENMPKALLTLGKKTILDMVIDKTPNKTKYTYKSDEALDLNGIQIIVTYSDSSTKVIYNPIGITAEGFSTAMAGKQNITVEYEGLTDEYEITVGYTWWQMIIRILLLGFLWY